MKVNGRTLTLISRLCYPITSLGIVVNKNKWIFWTSYLFFVLNHFVSLKVPFAFLVINHLPIVSVAVLIYFTLNFWLYCTSLLYIVLNFYINSSHSHQLLHDSFIISQLTSGFWINFQLRDLDPQFIVRKLLLSVPIWGNKLVYLNVKLLQHWLFH